MSRSDLAGARFNELARAPGNCVLEGFHAVKHAIRFEADILAAICLDVGDAMALAQALAPDVTDKLQQLLLEWPVDEWKRLGLEIPRTGVMAVAARRPYDKKRLLGASKPVVFLEEPRNLGNVGAVIRVAAAADAGGVMISGTVDPWSGAVSRGAAGLQYALPVIGVSALPETDRAIYALDPEGSDIQDAEIHDNAILAFGTERGGLSEALLSRATKRVAIPMRDKVSSMNLATSVAVALYVLKLRS